MSKILIAEDNLELRQLFTKVLQKNGYTVKGVSSSHEVLEAVHEGFDLVISDAAMPTMNVLKLVKQLREVGCTIPVLVITAKDTFDEMSHGLSSDNIEYMITPINVKEMVLKIAGLLCRVKKQTAHRQILGNTILEADSMTVTEAGRSTVLPKKEFQLLYKMACNPGRIFTRQQLLDDLWKSEEESDSHIIELYIGKLRERFLENEDFKIVTMCGIGYKLALCT